MPRYWKNSFGERIRTFVSSSKAMRPASWTTPKYSITNFKLRITKSKTRNLKFVIRNWFWRLRQDLNPQPQDSYSCALIPLSYKAVNKMLAEDAGFEPASDECAAVFRTAALPIRLISREKNVRSEAKTFALCFRVGNWQARSDLNWKFRFWRPTFCQLKLSAYKKNGVSDGIWTRSIRFGRPLLSHLSFAHKIY